MSWVGHAPQLTAARAEQVAAQVFGVTASAHGLPSERDQNFRLDVAGTPTYVLKVANPVESAQTLAAQDAAMGVALAAGLPVQRTHRAISGEAVVAVDGHLVRLLDWLPGVPMGSLPERPERLLGDLGRVLGRLSRALDGFDHPAAHRDFHWDVLNAPAVVGERLDALPRGPRRALVERVLGVFTDWVQPRAAALRRAVLHGDANDYNVLVDPGAGDDPFSRYVAVSGLLDFGDLVHSAVVAEPAVAAAYACLAAGDPLAATATVMAGFHAEFPLTADEVAVTWALVCARLAMSVCHSAVHRHQRPDDPYLTISEEPAWAALELMADVHPRFAHYLLRDACGLDPHPDGAAVRDYLAAASPSALLGRRWDEMATFAVDLSVGSATFGADDVAAAPGRFDALIRSRGRAAPDAVGLGGYGEARLIYTAPQFATGAEPDGEHRTVHTAVDVWCPAGTPVHAPLPGTVVASHDNAARLDFGPVVVLAHRTGDGAAFFTLYGHLSPASLARSPVGRQLGAGDVIGEVGSPPGNGDWAPHVHVQVVLDLLDLGPDYPGVAAPSHRSLRLGLSPDPAVLLGLAPGAVGGVQRPLAVTLADRRRLLGPSLSLAYRSPLRIVRGVGARLYDDQGRSYLDAVNNVAHVGHAHPRVVAAAAGQMAVLNTNTRYLHENVLSYAQRLTATLPDPLSVCFFVNSGSEANELALRLVRTCTGARDMICLQDGYHGNTQALVEVSPYKHDGPGGSGPPDWVTVAARPDPYRGPHRGYGQDAAAAYADDVRRCVDQVTAAGRPVAGMIAEPMVGCGGQVVLPAGYLARAAQIVREAGGLFIADEVQVGLGRVGPQMWGFATQGVVPDVVTIGKPAGNGHPLAAVVTTPAVAQAFVNGMEYFNTFGGNPVSAAVGMAVLDVLDDEQLPQRAQRLGRRLLDGVAELAARHPLIGDARGLGMYAGVELVRDRDTLAPAAAEADYVVERMKDLGVLVSIDGPMHNVLKIKPPLVWTDNDLDQLLSTLDRVLAEPALRR